MSYDSSNGLSATTPRADQSWIQNSPSVEDSAEEADRFGESLSTGDFNGDRFYDLAIGVVFEDVQTIDVTFENAGAVNVLYGFIKWPFSNFTTC